VAFPVVALGASAGGLEALRQLFARLPVDAGIAFVVIQHLEPDRPSLLAEVLAAATTLSVVQADTGMRLAPRHVYVIPPASDLSIHGGVLTLVPRQRTGGLHLPIDTFFRALAEDAKRRAIGVVLSGTGSDGTAGLRAIKAEGGIAIAQEPASAQFSSMPEQAIAAGVVDFRGSPEAIAGELSRLSRHPYTAAAAEEGGDDRRDAPEPDRAARVATILAVLCRHTGIDFSRYKRTTILRRIDRRMALRRVASLAEYASDLERNAGEARALANDMLIQFTSFFRDPDAFEALKERVFKALLQRKDRDDAIRIWVAGCATGEEAYTVIICLLESMENVNSTLPVKLFGTDLSGEAIDAARLGVYSEAALDGVSPARRERFFERTAEGYRIRAAVRDHCVFVKHDLARDPPFAKLDLISCRNVLIYFDAELQRRIVPVLHYCLGPQGYLFVGQSEALTGFRDLFVPVDQEHRILQRIGNGHRLAYPLPAGRETEALLGESRPSEHRTGTREAQRQADHLLLARYAPPGVIVNQKLDIVQFRGRTGAYLEPPPGQPQANLLRMARRGLVAHLQAAVERARTDGMSVQKKGLRVQLETETQVVDLEVVPLSVHSDAIDAYFLVLFEPADVPRLVVGRTAAALSAASLPADTASLPADTDDLEFGRLRSELMATKDYLQSLLSERQSTADELAAANEELVAANEELQSTNEELQSAKEELQSTNEELSTLNDQLHLRNAELDEIASDLGNVLASVEIPVIIVDLLHRVRRFTPAVRHVASFIPEDVGRPIDDLRLKVQVDDIGEMITQAIDGLKPMEWEVQAQDGRWLRLQIRPYRTLDNRLDGAVLSFVDVDALTRAVDDAKAARDYARSIVETVTAALVVLDSDLGILSANAAFYDAFGLSEARAVGRCVLDLGALWQTPALRQALERASTELQAFNALELTHERAHDDRRCFSISGRPILRSGGPSMVLLTVDDVTSLRSLETERAQLLASEKQARVDAERATRAKDLFLATLSHELRTPLSTMLMSTQLLREIASDDERIDRASASIERAASAQAKLIDDLLDVSRIVSGKLMLDLRPVHLAAVVQESVDLARPVADAKRLALDLRLDDPIEPIYGDPARLLQVANNLVGNAIKFTPPGGRISVCLDRVGDRARLTVTDTGMGIRAEVLPRLFARFVQADSSVTRTHGGLGLGLSIVHHLVRVHGGEVQAESAGEGCGATFRVTLPVGMATHTSGGAGSIRATVDDIEGVRVLLVEDDDDTREVYSAMLTALGAEVRAAPSAARGLILLRESLPDVILSDIAMPGEDGFSFIQAVRALEPGRGGLVPAAALTALATDENRRRVLHAGFQLHVSKPLDAARLVSVVAALGGGRRRDPPTRRREPGA
jgi:two-component system CheB/CheR fusion protein